MCGDCVELQQVDCEIVKMPSGKMLYRCRLCNSVFEHGVDDSYGATENKLYKITKNDPNFSQFLMKTHECEKMFTSQNSIQRGLADLIGIQLYE